VIASTGHTATHCPHSQQRLGDKTLAFLFSNVYTRHVAQCDAGAAPSAFFLIYSDFSHLTPYIKIGNLNITLKNQLPA
jgi:hypothetical protein